MPTFTSHPTHSPSEVSALSTESPAESPSQASLYPPPRISSNESSIPSNNHHRTPSSGPTPKDPPLILSKWGIGWQTPTLMLGAYFFALATAFTHFALFTYLDSRPAAGPRAPIRQAYVSTLSNILANVFGYSLKGSLALAFVQHLWYLLRTQTMRVSTIELLFSIRTNPFALLRPAALRATPVLCALALILWVLQVVISLPPGAISVGFVQDLTFQEVLVPTYNASFMGNGSGVEASMYALNKLEPDPPFGFTTGGVDGDRDNNLIPRLANQILISGETLPMTSPCGSNCTYVTSFIGPAFTCNQSQLLETYSTNPDTIQIYNGTWFSPRQYSEVRPYRGNATKARFDTSVFTPLSADADAFITHSDDNAGQFPTVTRSTNGTQETNTFSNGSLVLQQDMLTCIPGMVTYTINHTYVNNVHTRTSSASPLIDVLTSLAPLTKDSAAIVPGFCGNGPPNLAINGLSALPYGTVTANWTEATLAYYRDNNFMVMFDSLMNALQGTYTARIKTPLGLNLTHPDRSVTYNTTDLPWLVHVDNAVGGKLFSIAGQNGSIIDSTRLNTAYGRLSASSSIPFSFNVTEDTLNAYLLNMTLSISTAYGLWNTSSNATIATTVTVYLFSSPLSLLLPYFISLGLSLPFILLGFVSLHRNGVAATDGGFEQLITTSTGSAVLDRAAAGGCLGGSESVPQELKDLKIRYGEFVGRDSDVKRAGFGVDSEVVPLRKGAKYGVARWV